MIIYSDNPLSIFKACLLAIIQDTDCQSRHMERSLCLFSQEEVDADCYNLDCLIRAYTNKVGGDLDWLGDHRISRLNTKVNYALRHSSSEKYKYIQTGLEDAITYGLDYFLGNVSANCRKLTNLAREVSHEVQRMVGYIRFTAYDERTLVAKPKLFHNTADLILRKFADRYPNYRIILILEDYALCIEKGIITKDTWDNMDLNFHAKDEYSTLWREYYKSQYIESRKNITLAQKAIPQKYWDWMIEGKILAEEKRAHS